MAKLKFCRSNQTHQGELHMYVPRRLIFVIVLALGGAAMAAPPTAAGSSDAPNDRLIAFRAYDREAYSWSIWTANPDGSEAHQVYIKPRSNLDNPAWSPGRSTILFDISAGENAGQMATVSIDGTGYTQLTHFAAGCGGGEADYSPDGRTITFEYGCSTIPSIWMMNADGSNPHPLLSQSSYTFGFQPRYSPNGSRIVFVRPVIVAGEEQDALFVANANGTQAHQITPYHSFILEYPHWSPDGDWITYEIHPFYRDLADGGIWRVRPNGEDRQIVYPDGRMYGWYPDFSPNGTRIVFSCFVRAEQQFDLCVMKVDGSGLHRIVRTPKLFEKVPVWS